MSRSYIFLLHQYCTRVTTIVEGPDLVALRLQAVGRLDREALSKQTKLPEQVTRTSTGSEKELTSALV
jgi:hypothetical protein